MSAPRSQYRCEDDASKPPTLAPQKNLFKKLFQKTVVEISFRRVVVVGASFAS